MNTYKMPEMRCSVYGCGSRLSLKTFDTIKLHAFPQKAAKRPDGKSLLMAWIGAIKLSKKYTKRMRVCSLHFANEDFENTDDKKSLKKEAVPTKLLPNVWRNKFFPRDYGRMIKQLEYRGIGKLRLCHEAKLVKRLSKINNKREEKEQKPEEQKSEPDSPIKKQNTEVVNAAEGKINTPICVPKVCSAFSLSEEVDQQDDKQGETPSKIQVKISEDHNFTSEIMIKEEPLSENEDMEEEEMMHEEDVDMYPIEESEEPKDKEETVEEMLAKMNADDSNTGMSDDKKIVSKKNVSELNFDYEDTMDSAVSMDKFCSVCGEEECMCDEGSRFFHCVPCGKVFRTSRQLNAHNLSHFEYKSKKLSPEEQRAKDQMMKETTCKVCHKVLSTKMTLTEHMLIHSGEKPHVCMLCDKAFRHKANLVQHVNTHTLVRNYKCKMCRQYFCTTEELDKHVRKHRVMKKEYSCRECGQSFRTKSACWAHLNTHARGRAKSGLPCQVCGRVLSTKATLKEHMFIHSGEKPFECLLCGKKIRHRANFIIHVQGHSLGQPHVCLTCGTSFPKKGELNSHIAAKHPNDTSFSCIICGMRFRSEKRFHKHAVTHDATLDEA